MEVHRFRLSPEDHPIRRTGREVSRRHTTPTEGLHLAAVPETSAGTVVLNNIEMVVMSVEVDGDNCGGRRPLPRLRVGIRDEDDDVERAMCNVIEGEPW